MSEDKKEDMIPDKSVYQTNRRRMAWDGNVTCYDYSYYNCTRSLW